MTGEFAPIGLYNGKLQWKHRTLSYWLSFLFGYSTYFITDDPDPDAEESTVLWSADITSPHASGTYYPLVGATGTPTVTLT